MSDEHEPCCDVAAAAAQGWRDARTKATRLEGQLATAAAEIDRLKAEVRKKDVTRERFRQHHPETVASFVERLGEAERILRRVVDCEGRGAMAEARKFLRYDPAGAA